MSNCGPEVHLGDVGTLYKARILDNCVDFDPSTSTVRKLIFSVPGGVLTKTAQLTTDGSPATKWYLEYLVVPGDGLGSPAGDFHAAIGKVKIQAYLEWADGSRFHSDIKTTDDQGRELKIYANLD